MCTNFVLIKRDGTSKLANKLGVDASALIYSQNFKPGSTISIVTGPKNNRQVHGSVWWLYLQQTKDGLKPHKDYFSVNTNHANLGKKNEYRTSRCIIPASAFVESQDGKYPHLLEPEDGSAIALGGLYKIWTDETTGEVVHSASIITLPGHPALENIHKKSTPLWLPEQSFDRWLAPDVTDTGEFAELLIPALRTTLRATPIDKVFTKLPIAPSFAV